MKLTKQELKGIINECINEIVNEEARMAASDLDSILHHANELKQLGAITDDANVEDWIKAKLTVAKENITAIFNYYNHDASGDSPDADDAGSEPVSAINPVGATADAGEDTGEEVEDIGESCGSDCDCKKCSNKMEERKKKWIGKAVDPKHKGYCTPMTKPTCTPSRKALAKRFKKGI